MIINHLNFRLTPLSLPGGRSRILERFGALTVANEEQRIERILAAARTFLAGTSLVAIWLDPTQPAQYATYAYGLMGFYVLYSLLIQFLVLFRNPPMPTFRLAVHSVDILWPALMSLVTTGPNSPFFIYNVFVLSAAAYRWGLRETLATAGVAITLYTSEGLLAFFARGAVPSFLGENFELNRLLLRGLNLLILGYLLGYLGEEERLLRAEASATARITGRIQASVGLRAALQNVMNELCLIFGAAQILLVLQELGTGRQFLWHGRRQGVGQPLSLLAAEPPAADRARYVFDAPAGAWHAILRTSSDRRNTLDLVALDQAGRRQRDAVWAPPQEFLETYPFRQMLGASLAYGDEWSGSMLLLDPKLKTTRQAAVSFLQALVRSVGPALYNVYLTSHLRLRAGAVERARVARELHDGVIQSMISLEMQMDVLRRQEGASPEHVAAELQRIQLLMRQEVLNLRELMQQMTPVHVAPKHLVEFLAYTVDKFRRDSGISATFTSALQEVALPPRVCTEVARILQEALANIRKHSGAHNVLVRLDSAGGLCKLIVDDDGRGFDFTGHLSQDDLDIARRGPMVIKERVRSINGTLSIDSNPGGGARLEITFPQKTDA